MTKKMHPARDIYVGLFFRHDDVELIEITSFHEEPGLKEPVIIRWKGTIIASLINDEVVGKERAGWISATGAFDVSDLDD